MSKEPVEIDGIYVELSKFQQRKWDTGDEVFREQVRETIREYREEDGPQFAPPTARYEGERFSYTAAFGEED